MQALMNFLLLVLMGVTLRNYLQTRSLIRQIHELDLPETATRVLRLDFPSKLHKQLVIALNRHIRASRESVQALRAQQQNVKLQMTSITHDLRTPLTSVIGYLDLLEDEEQTEQSREYLAIVQKKAAVLQELVSDFHELAKIEDADYPMEYESVEPQTLLEDILMSYYDEFQKKNIDLHMQLLPSPAVLASPRDLLRVYSNLIENILKHGEKEAWITHRASRGVIRTVFANRFSKDRPFDEREMFERFYSGDASRNEHSSGLGLFMAKLLIEKQGHSIAATVHRGILFITLTYRPNRAQKSIE